MLIGNAKAQILEDNKLVGGKNYLGTEGLWSLITLKEPDESVIMEEDKAKYKEILENTSAHNKGCKTNA